jgi:hypothetical protein
VISYAKQNIMGSLLFDWDFDEDGLVFGRVFFVHEGYVVEICAFLVMMTVAFVDVTEDMHFRFELVDRVEQVFTAAVIFSVDACVHNSEGRAVGHQDIYFFWHVFPNLSSCFG